MEATKIRHATQEDLDILLRFEQGMIQIERPFDATLKEGPNHYYDLPAMIASPEAELVVAEIDGVIVGCGYARIEAAKHYLKHTHHAYLGFMYVDPTYRGKGVNSLIIEELTKWAISKNVFELRLDVYQDNERAIRAYEKVGFKRYLVKMRLGLNQ
jgi:GNAT superfamily N-acetyltransferase